MKKLLITSIVAFYSLHSFSQKEFKFELNSHAIGTILLNDSIPIATGFVVGKGNWIATCYHIESMNPGPKAFQPTYSKKQFNLTLLVFDPKIDIAIYQADELVSERPLQLDTSFQWSTGKTIIYIGYDATASQKKGPTLVARKSTIESAGSVDDGILNTKFIEFVGEGIPGYSGGPVFNSKGEVIAIFAQSFYRQGLHSFSAQELINRAFSVWAVSKLIK